MIPVARPDYSIFCVLAAEGARKKANWTVSNPSLNKDVLWRPNKSLEMTRGQDDHPRNRSLQLQA